MKCNFAPLIKISTVTTGISKSRRTNDVKYHYERKTSGAYMWLILARIGSYEPYVPGIDRVIYPFKFYSRCTYFIPSPEIPHFHILLSELFIPSLFLPSSFLLRSSFANVYILSQLPCTPSLFLLRFPQPSPPSEIPPSELRYAIVKLPRPPVLPCLPALICV